MNETISLGCFYLAGPKSGLWKDVKSLKGKTIIEKIFYTKNDNARKMKNCKIWKSAVESVLKWHNDLNILKE